MYCQYSSRTCVTFLSVLIALTNQTTAQNLLELIEVRLSQHETKLRAIVEEGVQQTVSEIQRLHSIILEVFQHLWEVEFPHVELLKLQEESRDVRRGRTRAE